MFFEKKQLNNCLTASFRKQNLESRTVIFFEFIKKKKQYLLSKEIDATEFYTFRYKNQLFLLLFGQIVLFSGWSQKIQQILEKSINQVDDQIENVYLKDHTYSEEKNSRRLRSLGGSLRKMFSLIESSDKVLTKKEIIKDLEYFVILGNKEKLVNQIFAVEKNAKLNYQIDSKNLKIPLDQHLNLTKSKILEHLSDDREGATIKLIDNFQKEIKDKIDELKKTFSC